MKMRWHKDWTNVTLVVASLVIGALIISINTLNYNNKLTKYSVKYDDTKREMLTIRDEKPFRTVFELESPERIEALIVKFKIKSIGDGVTLRVSVNNMNSGSLPGLKPKSVQEVHFEGKQRMKNMLTISASYSFDLRDVVLDEVVVSAYTYFDRAFLVIFNIIGLIILLSPILLIQYRKYILRDELENRFPDFLRDVVEGSRAGMSLTQAIKNTKKTRYGKLTPFVNKIVAQLDWGMPFEKSLKIFAKESGSVVISRAVRTIIQTYKSGGKINSVLESVSNNLKEIKKLKKERESELYGEMITGYVVFFVFLAVVIVIMKYLIPELGISGDISSIKGGTETVKSVVYTFKNALGYLIAIQAVFSGLVIGKLSEGELKAGAKHIAILLAVGYTAYLLFI